MAQNPHDMNVVKHLYTATGGTNVSLEQRKEALRQLVGNDQRLMTPATMLVMNEEGKLRDQAMKLGQQPTVAAKALGFAPPAPQMSPAGLGATPQGMQMASAAPMAPPQGMPAPQAPVQMAGGGLTTLPMPDYMFDEQSFAGGGIVAFAKGSPGEVEQDSFWSKVGQLPSERRKKGAPSPTDRERNSYRDYARGRAAAMGLDPNFVDQLFLQESKYDPYAMSGTGPRGIGQFTGETGKEYGLLTREDRFNPKKSIDAGLAHISDLSKRYKGDPTLVAAGYNRGITSLNKHLRENNGVLNLDNYLDKYGKPTQEPKKYVSAVAYGKGTGEKQIASVRAPQTQMARKEPPAPTIYDLARSTLPGISSAAAPPVRDARFDRPPVQYMAQPQMPRAQMPQFDVAAAEAPPVQVAQDARFDRPPIQYMAQPQMPRAQMPQFDVAEEAPTRATQLASGLGAAAAQLNPISTARAAEAPKPKAQAQPPAEPYVDPVGKFPYVPTYLPLDPNKPMPSKAKRYADVASQFVGAGAANLLGGTLNTGAEAINRTANFFTKPIDPNEGAPAAPVTPKQYGEVDKYTGPGNQKGVRHYTMGEDPALEAALAGKTPAAEPADAAPVAAKETSEEALARILAANKSNNFWSTMAAAGFNTAAGKSQNALENFGSGFAAALPGMAAANKSDRELALKQQELAQQKEISEKQISASTGFQKEAVDNLTQDYVRQGLPLVIARGRATRDVMTAGANQWSAGAPLNTQMQQLQRDIQYLEAVRPDDPSLPEKRKLLADAQAKFAALGSGGSGSGATPSGVVKAASYFP